MKASRFLYSIHNFSRKCQMENNSLTTLDWSCDRGDLGIGFFVYTRLYLVRISPTSKYFGFNLIQLFMKSLRLVWIHFLLVFWNRGLWNVPFISSCYLIKKDIFPKITYTDDHLDAEMAFCKNLRVKVSEILHNFESFCKGQTLLFFILS